MAWLKACASSAGRFTASQTTFPTTHSRPMTRSGWHMGLERGWVPMCKDGRIKGRRAERAPIETHAAVLFYLDNQQLRRAEMISRFHSAKEAIHHAIARGGPAIYSVTATGIRHTWP